MLRICMLTTSEIFHDTRILNEARSLAKIYDVLILARQYPKQTNIKYPFIIKLIDYWRMPFFQLDIFFSLLSLMEAAFKENPDVYHAHDLDGLLCAFPAALIKRKILIYDSHEFWSDTYPFGNLRGIRWLLPLLERILILKVTRGITVNELLAEILSCKYHCHFIALHNSVKLENKKKPILDFKRIFPKKEIILHLGAADEGRGMEQMIEAAKLLPKSYITIFVGGGKTERDGQMLVEKYNLKNKVYFFPAILPEKIISTIKSADIGLALTQKVSKSYYYSLPNKLFQYIAAEVPILGSNFPEFKKIILKNKIGEVVDPSKPKLIARKIIEMLEKNNQKKYRRNLVGLAKEKYNWDVEAKKILKFYEEIKL